LDALIRELTYYRGHTDAPAVLYAMPEHVHKYILNNRSQVREYAEKTGFEILYRVSEQKQFERLCADKQEKIEDFAKKTGNFQLYHI
jgi:MinD superfamily P-loop ATPase